jgi:DNA polymerase-4
MQKNINQNDLKKHLTASVMFIDMNSFFASCEQQDDPELRGKPLVVCTYKSPYSPIIAPSIEAKKFGIRTGMRTNEAKKLCPDIIQVETSPNKYRDYHVKIMDVLRSYSQDVIPKSIDEAVINFKNYYLVYKDLHQVGLQIKKDINNNVGDWLKCSIGLAPNTFLAKLASGIVKPNGFVTITPDTIDEVLGKLKLESLPGIAKSTARKLVMAGINSPLELRYAQPLYLKNALKSIVGYYWHCRLNFMEVDLSSKPYKSMQAMRQISKENRESLQYLQDLLLALCMRIEKRMVAQELYCRSINISMSFEGNNSWGGHTRSELPIQDGNRLLDIFKKLISDGELETGGPLLNNKITSMSLNVSAFVNADLVQSDLFYTDHKRDKLRKTVYELKNRFGHEAVMKGAEVTRQKAFQDMIGFGSIKDLQIDNEWSNEEDPLEDDYDIFD